MENDERLTIRFGQLKFFWMKIWLEYFETIAQRDKCKLKWKPLQQPHCTLTSAVGNPIIWLLFVADITRALIDHLQDIILPRADYWQQQQQQQQQQQLYLYSARNQCVHQYLKVLVKTSHSVNKQLVLCVSKCVVINEKKCCKIIKATSILPMDHSLQMQKFQATDNFSDVESIKP